jgi:hypothetical protein
MTKDKLFVSPVCQEIEEELFGLEDDLEADEDEDEDEEEEEEEEEDWGKDIE